MKTLIFNKFVLLNLIILSFAVQSCELIVIKAENRISKPIIIPLQDTPLGAIFLFKYELNENNIPAATQVLVKNETNKYLAIEKVELYDDVARFGRLIENTKNITKIDSDTLSLDSLKFKIEFDYVKKYEFHTVKIQDRWYILNYSYE